MIGRKRLFIVTLEKIEKRYTKQWYDTWKPAFKKYFDVVDYIDGDTFLGEIEKGRFLDINKTNLWKGNQVQKISYMFQNNIVENGDVFLFADGWHFGITALKYMIQLNNIDAKIFAYWHAGSWDKHDFISQAGLGKWAKYNEMGWFYACDGHFVATRFHKSLILRMFKKAKKIFTSTKIHVVGFPMDWEKAIEHELGKDYVMPEKEDLIVFPHRLDPEKCPEIFDNFSKHFPKYKFVKTMEVTKNKKEYYELLSRAKLSISTSQQETFGIGTVEAMMLGCFPLVPRRLSYVELYDGLFQYSELGIAKQKIKLLMDEYNNKSKYMDILEQNQKQIKKASKRAYRLMSEAMLISILHT